MMAQLVQPGKTGIRGYKLFSGYLMQAQHHHWARSPALERVANVVGVRHRWISSQAGVTCGTRLSTRRLNSSTAESESASPTGSRN